MTKLIFIFTKFYYKNHASHSLYKNFMMIIFIIKFATLLQSNFFKNIQFKEN